MMKKLLSAALAATMMLGTLPVSHAVSDIDGHWAKKYLTAMHELEIINPSSSGAFTPETPIARWEFMRYINRAFDFTEKAEISFTDVPANAAYYDTVATAVHYGYINGVGAGRMDPLGTLTREQAATILGRLHKYTPAGASSLPFSDRDKISSYSRDYVAEAVARGYINGYTDGTFKPQNSLKRGEIAKILYFYLGTSLNKRGGVYTGADLRTDTKNLSISQPCTLTNATVEGNLYITEGVGTGRVDLQNVTVEGRIIVAGGETAMNGVSSLEMTVYNPCRTVPTVICAGNTSIAHTEVRSSAKLYETGLSVSAGGYSNLTLDGENLSLTLDASVWNLDIEQPATVLTTGSTLIDKLTARARSTVTGGGSIQRAALSASGCELVMRPASLELASGVVATVAGERVQSDNSISISPSTLSLDIGNASSIAHSYDFTFNADENDLSRVTVDGIALVLGRDYNLLTGDRHGIRLYRTFLSTLDAGSHTARLTFADNSTAALSIAVRDSSVVVINPRQITFDRYEKSANHANIPLTISLPAGVQLENVKLSSAILERGVDYDYNSSTGEVVLLAETLAKKSTGSYTIYFTPSRGAAMTCALTVVDTRPVNRISPEEVDFDANSSSGGYRDITLTLTAADGAKLEKIRCKDKDLEQDWHYRVDGSEITISKSAIASFAENGTSYADFTFQMSKGQDPKLRVNFVTTYPLSALVVDDLGLPIRGATVTFSPTDSETGSAVQTVSTDEDGRAAVYVKRGSYTVTASHERFTKPISQTVNVTSSRSIELTGEILENVQFVVTNRYGAMLQGATVTIGGVGVTTGADGIAAFSLRRSDYLVQAACSGFTGMTMQLTVTDSGRVQIQLAD